MSRSYVEEGNGIYVATHRVSRYEFVVGMDTDLYWETIKRRLKSTVGDVIVSKVLEYSPVTVFCEYVQWDDYTSDNPIGDIFLQLRVRLYKVNTVDIVIPKFDVSFEMPYDAERKPRKLCTACGNVWIQSSRGGCNSCGAPASWTF